MSRFILFSFGLLAAVLLVSGLDADGDCETGKSHDAFYGERQPRDHLIWSDHVRKSSKYLSVVEADYTFRPRQHLRNQIITKIELIDHDTDGTGGCGTIKSGGVGSNSVVINIKSQQSKGFDFSIRIWGV